MFFAADGCEKRRKMNIRKRYNPVNLDKEPIKVHRGRTAVPEVAKRRNMKLMLIIIGSVVTLIMFVFVSLWLLTDLGNGSKSKKEPAKKVENEEYIYSEKDSLAVLIAMTNDNADTAEHLILMRIDPSRWDEGKGYAVCFMSIPPDMITGEGELALSQHYALGGTAECARVIKEISGAREIYSATINYKSVRKLIAEVGGITVTVEHNINYTSPKGDRNFTTAAGTREFNASEGARLIYCDEWPGGIDEQRLMICRSFASMANKLITRKNSNYLDYYFNKITNAVPTNVSAGAYQEIKTGLKNFALDNESADITKIYLCGYEEREDGRLYLTEDGVLYLKALFGEHN